MLPRPRTWVPVAIVSQGRKFGLWLTLANQAMYQLTEKIKSAVLGNVSTFVIFRIDEQDIRYFKLKTGYYEPERLADLPQFQALFKVGDEQAVIGQIPPPMPPPAASYAEIIRKRTVENYACVQAQVFTTIKSLAGTAWGDESARVIINAIDAVCEFFTHPTPVHVFRFMADDKFREKVLKQTENPFLKMFKEQYDEKLRNSEQMSKFSPPINKVGKLLRPAILSIIGQPKSLNFLDVMNKRRIVVCRFSKGRLGEEIAQILGSLVVSMVSIAALKREKQKKRPPFLLVVDETHNFTHGGRFNTLLAEGRKFGIALVSGTQGMYQLPFARDLLANCPTQIVFNSMGEDAEMLARNWGEESKAREITGLSRYRFISRTFENDIPKVRTVLADPAVQKRGNEANQTKLIKQSLMRWGTKKKEVEAKIYKFLAS